MKPHRVFRFVLLGLLALIVVSVATAFAADIATPAVNVDVQSSSVDANDLKPAACSGLSLTTVVTGSVTILGTTGNDLILGSAGADAIDGQGGNDCILGGGGDDTIDGNTGTDVCIGGAGTDSLLNCETGIE